MFEIEQEVNTQDVDLLQENNDGIEDTDVDLTDVTGDSNDELANAKAEAAKWKAIAERQKRKASSPSYKPNIKNTGSNIDEEIVSTVKKLSMIEEKRQFGYENGLSPEETDHVFRVSGGKPTKAILEDPFVKAGLEGYRSSKRVADNTPSSSSNSLSFGGKPFAELDDQDRQKAFAERTKGLRK